MKIASLLAAFASPLLAYAADEPEPPLLRGSGAMVASDADGNAAPSFGIPDFLAQPEYCSKSCFRDCNCYSDDNNCHPKCCKKDKGSCPNNHMPPCEPPHENHNPPKIKKDDPSKCPNNNNDDDNDDDDDDNRDGRNDDDDDDDDKRKDDDDDDNSNRDSRCDDNNDCKSNYYCQFSDCDTNSSGRCKEGGRNHNNCSKNKDDVCGCDERTYDNECKMRDYGVSKDYNGHCKNGNRTVKNFDGSCRKDNDCSNNYYCKPLLGDCNTNKRDGFCTKIPKKNDCNVLKNNKVCTCNGKTEDNECWAEYNQRGVDYYGKC